MWRRFVAVFRARLPEFYRDKASLTWNILMPLFLIAGFAFVFSDESETLFKVGIYGEKTDMPFFDLAQVQFIAIDDLPQAIEKLRRHQGEDILSAGHPAMTAIKLHSPHRVFESASARIEVYQPIPSRTRRESTPEGPHTHLLPAFIGRRDESLSVLPEDARPVLTIYPSR